MAEGRPYPRPGFVMKSLIGDMAVVSAPSGKDG